MNTDTDADYIRMVEEIQRGENVNENLKVLTEAFKGVVIAAAQKSGRRQEIADIINDAPLFIYKAALSYDPNRGAGFAGYLTRKVGWFIGHEWQKRHDRIERKGKKTKWVPRVFLPVQDFDFIAEQTHSSEFDYLAFNRAVTNLPPRDRKLIESYLSTGNAATLAGRYRRSAGFIYNRINRIRPVLATLYQMEKDAFPDLARFSDSQIESAIPVPRLRRKRK